MGELIARLLRGSIDIELSDRDLAHVAAHISQRISLGDLAGQAGADRSHLRAILAFNQRLRGTGDATPIDASGHRDFSVATVDLSRLLHLLSELVEALSEYESWVARFGYSSLATAEALVNALYDANQELRREMVDHWNHYHVASSVQTGLYAIVSSITEAVERIDSDVPNDPAMPSDNPHFLRLSDGMDPVRFGELTASQLIFARDNIADWIAVGQAAEIAATPAPETSHQDAPALVSDPITISEMAKLGLVNPKTVRNWGASGRPLPAIHKSGRRAAIYSYAALREWFISRQPDNQPSWPSDYEKARDILRQMSS